MGANMAIKRASKRAGMAPAADPNVIPFIDVLLVLLIIFMVTAPQPTTDLRLNLPRQGAQPSSELSTIVDVRQDLGGVRYAVDGEDVPFALLAERTYTHATRNNPAFPAADVRPYARVLVRADQDTAYGNVVMVVDELQTAQFGSVGIFGQRADAS
jgi:biopolymer transport protein ExbD